MVQQKTILLIVAAVVIVGAIGALIYVPTFQQQSRGLGLVGTQTSQETAQEAEQGLTVGRNIGQLAPDFALEDAEGNVVRLSDFRGQVVFLNFWASWCPFCVDEMPDIQEAGGKFGDDVVVLFVNRGESISIAQNYIDNVLPVKLTQPVIYDLSEDVYRTYTPGNFMPVSYIIDENGVVRDRKFGPLDSAEAFDRLNAVVNT